MLSKYIKSFDTALTKVIRIITIILFSIMSLMLLFRVVFRILSIKFSFHWQDELIEMCFAGIVFLGSAALWMTKGHFSAGNFIMKLMKNRIAVSIYKIILELVSLVFILVFLKYSYDLTMRSREVTAVLEIPKKILYGVMPVSGLIMSLYSFGFLIFEIKQLIKPDMAAE